MPNIHVSLIHREWGEEELCARLPHLLFLSWQYCLCIRAPRDRPALLLSRSTHRAILLGKIYYSKWIQSKISKGQRWVGWSPEEIKCRSRESSPTKFPRVVLNSFSNNVMWCLWSVVCQGISLETQCPSFLLRGWLNRHPLPGPCQNSRLLEEKQVFSINHVVYTSSLGIVSYSLSLG